MKDNQELLEYQLQKMVSLGMLFSLALYAFADDRWWDLRTLGMTAEMDLGAPISSMELAHGGGTLSVTSGSKVHFLDILRYVHSSSFPVYLVSYLVYTRRLETIRRREMRILGGETKRLKGKKTGAKRRREISKEERIQRLTNRQHPPVSIELPHPVTSASLHPFLRDRFIAGSTNDPWVRVYDLDSGKEKEVYKGHHGPVLCASYSPDGEVYASGSEDGTFLLLLYHRYPFYYFPVFFEGCGRESDRVEADVQEQYDYGRRILGKAMVCGRLASRFEPSSIIPGQFGTEN